MPGEIVPVNPPRSGHAVVGEYLGSSRGIGHVIAEAEGVFDTTGVFAGMTVLAGHVLLVGGAISRVERHLLRWKPPSTK
jgi:NitT/TauT family transport system permease protein